MGEFLMRMQFRQGQVRSLKMPRRLLEAEFDGGTALAGASGGEGGVGFLSSVWGTTEEGLGWA